MSLFVQEKRYSQIPKYLKYRIMLPSCTMYNVHVFENRARCVIRNFTVFDQEFIFNIENISMNHISEGRGWFMSWRFWKSFDQICDNSHKLFLPSHWCGSWIKRSLYGFKDKLTCIVRKLETSKYLDIYQQSCGFRIYI